MSAPRVRQPSTSASENPTKSTSNRTRRTSDGLRNKAGAEDQATVETSETLTLTPTSTEGSKSPSALPASLVRPNVSSPRPLTPSRAAGPPLSGARYISHSRNPSRTSPSPASSPTVRLVGSTQPPTPTHQPKSSESSIRTPQGVRSPSTPTSSRPSYERQPSGRTSHEQERRGRPSAELEQSRRPSHDAGTRARPSQEAVTGNTRPDLPIPNKSRSSHDVVPKGRPSQDAERSRPSFEAATKPRPSYEAPTRSRPSQELQSSTSPSQELQSSTRPSQEAVHRRQPSQDVVHRRQPSQDVEARRQPSRDVETRRGPSQDPETRQRPSQDIERRRRPSQDPDTRTRPSQELPPANRAKPVPPVPVVPKEDPQSRNRPSLEAERKRRRILYGVDPPPSSVAGPSQPRGRKESAIRFNEGTSNGHSDPRIHQAISTDGHHTQESSTRLSHEKTLDELPSFMPSQPYAVHKERSPEEIEFRKSMRKRRLRILFISAIIVMLLLVAIILLVRIVRPRIRHSVDNIGQDASSNLSQAQTQCLQTFRTDGPGNALGYSCSSCLPTLRSVSQQYLDNPSNAANADDISAAIQFCGLRAVFDSANQEGQTALTSSGWFQDIKTCTWSGVTCDDSGAITQL
jgi:hypothetical protein